MTQHVFSPDESRARNPEKWHDEQWRDILRLADFIDNTEIVRIHDDTEVGATWSLRSVFLNIVAGHPTKPPRMDIQVGDAFLGWIPAHMFVEIEQWGLGSESAGEQLNRMRKAIEPRDIIAALSVYIEDTYDHKFFCNCGLSYKREDHLARHLSMYRHPLNGPARLRQPHDYHREMTK